MQEADNDSVSENCEFRRVLRQLGGLPPCDASLDWEGFGKQQDKLLREFHESCELSQHLVDRVRKVGLDRGGQEHDLFSLPDEPSRVFKICISQPILGTLKERASGNSSQSEITEALGRYGFRSISRDAYFRKEDQVLLTDAAPRNVRVVDGIPALFMPSQKLPLTRLANGRQGDWNVRGNCCIKTDMQHLNNFMIRTLLLLFAGGAYAQDNVVVRDDWQAVFARFDAVGTVVVVDERKGSAGTSVFNPERANTRLSPASTFKIPHALFALDAGVLLDEFQVIPWDGVKRDYEFWNCDQTLRSSMRNSAVWVYEGFEKVIGAERERGYLEKIDYGNADPTGDSPFWVDGNLKISANEQIEFLRQLYRNKLPFSVANQRLVKDVILLEAGGDWILRGKTGWSGTVGWWVGWVERPEGVVFFALNIDTPNRADDLFKRQAITRQILESLNALPKKLEE